MPQEERKLRPVDTLTVWLMTPARTTFMSLAARNEVRGPAARAPTMMQLAPASKRAGGVGSNALLCASARRSWRADTACRDDNAGSAYTRRRRR
jgi:hypothetical protein